jgi:hypothetical protein
VKDALANNESSTNGELMDHFQKEFGLSHRQAAAWVKTRKSWLTALKGEGDSPKEPYAMPQKGAEKGADAASAGKPAPKESKTPAKAPASAAGDDDAAPPAGDDAATSERIKKASEDLADRHIKASRLTGKKAERARDELVALFIQMGVGAKDEGGK